jgi:hypothetical protein
MKPRNILKKGGIRSLLLRPPSMQGAMFIRPLHHHKKSSRHDAGRTWLSFVRPAMPRYLAIAYPFHPSFRGYLFPGGGGATALPNSLDEHLTWRRIDLRGESAPCIDRKGPK